MGGTKVGYRPATIVLSPPSNMCCSALYAYLTSPSLPLCVRWSKTTSLFLILMCRGLLQMGALQAILCEMLINFRIYSGCAMVRRRDGTSSALYSDLVGVFCLGEKEEKSLKTAFGVVGLLSCACIPKTVVTMTLHLPRTPPGLFVHPTWGFAFSVERFCFAFVVLLHPLLGVLVCSYTCNASFMII